MTIRQSRYILAETEREKKVRVTEVQRAEEDPFIRKSEIQQTVNNSTLPVSSRAVNLAIESINSNLDLKADKTELEGLATEDYVNEKIDEKDVGITEPELISKSVGSGSWLREGAYGLGSNLDDYDISEATPQDYIKKGTRFSYARGSRLGYSGIGTIVVNSHWLYTNAKAGSYNHTFYGEGRVHYGWWDGDSVRSLEHLTTNNTFPDSNGVLHKFRNPIDTLNTSDMADTVVDNDLIIVTSGAVFRAIKQLTDQIISLEARVRELEDGGV